MIGYVFLPGTGGGIPNLAGLQTSEKATRFVVINYPGWKRYLDPLFRPNMLVEQIADEIMAAVPSGPIHIVGFSIGGHLGYYVALRLQARGRKVAGLCAIDSMMRVRTAPTPTWKSRAFAEAMELLARAQFRELIRFGRARFWRVVIRVAGGRLPNLLRAARGIGWLSNALDKDTILNQELDVRIMGSEVNPGIAILGDNPLILSIPTAFLRTRIHASSDAPWRVRCAKLTIYEICGEHNRLFERENIDSVRQAFLAATRDWEQARDNFEIEPRPN